MINKTRIVENFVRLTEIDAPSYKEKEMSEALKKMLDELEIPYTEDNASEKLGSNCGNIYARWEGDPNRPAVLFSAHMDTVEPALGKKPVVQGDRIVSQGDTVLGADDIAGVVEILEGIQSIKESGKPHRTVELLFTVAEEVYTKGAAVYDYSNVEAKEAYCFDVSGDIGQGARRAPSLISFKILVTGRSSHAGFAPEKGINAIQTAAEAIAKIPQGQVEEETTVNIGTISGGVATNIVSESCTMSGEIRSFQHEKALAYLSLIQKTFETCAESRGAKIDFTSEIHFKAYEVGEEEAVSQNFLKALEEIGIKGELVSTLGGADNHQFVANGIRGLVVTCGMEQVHTTEEFVKIENLLKGAALVEKLAL